MLILALIIPYIAVFYGDILNVEDSRLPLQGVKKIEYKLLAEGGVNSLKIDNKTSEERESIFFKLMSFVNGNIEAVSVTLEDETVAVLLNNEEAERLINNFKAYYVQKVGIRESTIENIKINKEIKYQSYTCHPWELDTMDMALNKLLKLSSSKGLAVETTIIEKYTEEISPKVIMESSEELGYGESKTQQGENGIKDVEKKIIYNNEAIVTEEIIKEEIIKEATDTIIIQGTKLSEERLSAVISIPSRGTISSKYGVRWGRLHKGTDFAAKTGDPITAALDGVVIEAGYMGSYGNMILIDHGNGIETLYGHCSELKAKVGDKVKKGELIALVGNTGRSTGPHLHFEVRIDGEAKDSLEYLNLSQ